MISILARAAEAVGGIAKLAAILGISDKALYGWEQIPANRIVEIEKATGMARRFLRPDLYVNPRGMKDDEIIDALDRAIDSSDIEKLRRCAHEAVEMWHRRYE